MFTFTALSTLGGAILVISSSLAAVAKQDAWLAPVAAMLYGLPLIGLFCYLGGRYPGLTLIGIAKRIFGKWLGTIVSVGYVIFFISTGFNIPWYVGTFSAHTMHETPIPVILVLFIVALVITIYYGIEVIARASELFYIFVTILMALSFILVMPNIHIEYIRPVLENGVTPIMKSSVLVSAFIVFPVITILMIFPSHTNDVKAAQKAILKGFLWAVAVVFATVLMSVLVLGSGVVANSEYPTILLAREINIAIVLNRLEYAISIMWLVSEFFIAALYFYASIKGLSELLGLENHKRITAPMGLIALLFSWLNYTSSTQQANWIVTGFIPHSIFFGAIIPLLMFLIYKFKQYAFKQTLVRRE